MIDSSVFAIVILVLAFSLLRRQQPSPPPLPPINSLQKIIPTHFVIDKRKTDYGAKTIVLLFLLAIVIVLLLSTLLYFSLSESKSEQISTVDDWPSIFNEEIDTGKSIDQLVPLASQMRKVQVEVAPIFLLTLLITKRKLCLFEAGTDHQAESILQFREEHIESAQLLEFANLSENGVPVHPLQFQRYIREFGVDADCHVVIYDRGQMIWATHAFWIFTLFDHPKVSLLKGGFGEWKKLMLINPAQYRTNNGSGRFAQQLGNFRAQWNQAVICTFDDVMRITQTHSHDLIDSQDKEQYDGNITTAIYGHIRTAMNLPIEMVYDWPSQTWMDKPTIWHVLGRKRLQAPRPIVIYSSSAVRSSLTWFALRRLDYQTLIYAASWPEWLIRAPEYLKIIPKKKLK